MNEFGLYLKGDESPDQIEEIQSRLSLPLVKNPAAMPFYLSWTTTGWGMSSHEMPKLKPLVVDFMATDWQRRLKEIEKGGDILSRILRKVEGTRAIDATAGLGRDSLHLLALGFEVVAIERHPVLSALLELALIRAQTSPFAELFSRMSVIHADSEISLGNIRLPELRPDVIYLDPMFPEKEKKALSGKEMQIFHLLTKPDPAADQRLLRVALENVKDRVVVKRPIGAPPIFPGERHQLSGKSVRYDIYFPQDFAGQ